MVYKKTVIICSIIAFLIVVVIVSINIKKFKDEEYVAEENTQGSYQNEIEDQNLTQNELPVENTILEEETIEENQANTENTAVNEITQNEYQGEEEETGITEEAEENKDEKALNLVKQDWGEDDTVYYTIDNQSNSIYYISVRSKSTTATLAEYEVDVNQGTAKMK